MTEDNPTTFSVEVLAFPGAADQASLATSIAEAFGIPDDAAQRLVESAPVAVKQHADADTTRQLAKVLLSLGAEICIRNEQTGEKKIHRTPATGTPILTSRPPPAASEPPPPPSDPERVSDSIRPSQPAPLDEAAAALLARSAEVAALSGSKSAALDVCAACHKRIEKGESCPACGYSNKDGKRYCQKCDREMSVASDVSRRRTPLVLGAAAGLAASAASFHYFGIAPAALIVAVVLAVAFFTEGKAMALRCVPCKRIAEAYKLRPAERSRVASAKRRWVLASLLAVLIGIGVAAPALAFRPELHVDSFGIGWTAAVPFTHRTVERRVVTAPMEWGPSRVVIRRAVNTSFAVEGYQLLHVGVPEKVAVPKIDDATLERTLARAVEAALPGAKLAPSDAVDFRGRRARESAFTVTVDGRQLGGRVRAVVFERDVVMLLFVATGSDAASKSAGIEFLGSLQTTDGK